MNFAGTLKPSLPGHRGAAGSVLSCQVFDLPGSRPYIPPSFATPRSVKHVLFVCTGNICRSPMAEGLFRAALKGRKDVEVASAGVSTYDGAPPSEPGVE